jgi:RNA polymerase subunit RPABC4/transcription elongation factor Spt4
MGYCSACGSQITDNTKFCPECGTPTSEGSPNPTQRQQEYSGTLIKCPNCGEVLKSFEAACPSCGYELRGSNAADSVKEFSLRFVQVESIGQKIDLIRSFPIPNTKEDLFEFIILSKSNVDGDLYESGKESTHASARAVSDAWKSKFEQAYQKAKMAFGNDPEFQRVQILHDQMYGEVKKAKNKTLRAALIFGIVFALIMLITPILASSGNAKEDARLNTIVAEVESNLDDGEFKLALMNAESIEYEGSDNENKRQWAIKREYLIDKVIQVSAENGVLLERTPDVEIEAESTTTGGGFVEGFVDGLKPGLDEAKKNIDEFQSKLKPNGTEGE